MGKQLMDKILVELDQETFRNAFFIARQYPTCNTDTAFLSVCPMIDTARATYGAVLYLSNFNRRGQSFAKVIVQLIKTKCFHFLH